MKQLLLVGGGHAHLKVLAELAKRPLPGWQVMLVSPQPHQIYSGVLPGWIAGHYPLDSALIPLAPLARKAGVEFRQAAAQALDLAGGSVQCADGTSLPFDALSLDVGPAPALGRLPVDSDAAFPVRPLSGLVDAWPRVMREIGSGCRPYHVVIVGAGAGGLELAFAVRHRGMREGWTHLQVTLVGADDLPLAGSPEGARRRARDLLARHAIGWRGAHRALRISDHCIDFADHDPIPFDSCWIATGADAPAWLQDSGLARDEAGFVRVGPTLQSVSHPHIFAAGDVAAHPVPLPKSGVYAVRAGELLAANLRAFCTGARLREWTPQRRALYLVGTGGRRALGIWGAWSWEGAWAWRLKKRIDLRFVRGYGAQA